MSEYEFALPFKYQITSYEKDYFLYFPCLCPFVFMVYHNQLY